METYVVALDQGTTTSRAISFNQAGEIVSRAQYPFRQIYPQPGWVEHDPEEFYANVIQTAKNVIEKAGVDKNKVAGVGISNQ